MSAGSIAILNVGAGDTRLSFDKANPAEAIRAARIVKDMLRRGYALLVEVERDGQKKIIIGDKGERIKRIGMEARKDMEVLFDSKVMLNLWVKVKGGWSDDERALRSLGYGDL